MKDLLQVAARSGSGSAARALSSGLAGMRTSTRRLLVSFGIAAFLLYLGWDVFTGITGGTSSSSARQDAIAAPVPHSTSTTVPSGDVAFVPPETGRVTYAIDVSDIRGLPPNAQPGTVIDLWVTWQRPLTKVPKLQRLLRDVVLEQVAPPVTPTGPYVAMLSVPEREVHRLLWGDRYGALSATVSPAP